MSVVCSGAQQIRVVRGFHRFRRNGTRAPGRCARSPATDLGQCQWVTGPINKFIDVGCLLGRTTDTAAHSKATKTIAAISFRQCRNGCRHGRWGRKSSHGLAASVRPVRPAPPKIQCQCSRAVPSEPVENSYNSELRRISCFPSHSGHRAVLHRSRSENLRSA